MKILSSTDFVSFELRWSEAYSQDHRIVVLDMNHVRQVNMEALRGAKFQRISTSNFMSTGPS